MYERFIISHENMESVNIGNEMNNNELETYQRNMEVMMAQLTNMIAIVQERDREIINLRTANPVPTNVTGSAGTNASQRVAKHLPFSEISSQIPKFDDEDSTLDISRWIKRVDDVKDLYNLDDNSIRVLATNKLSGNIRKWYDADEEHCSKAWGDLKQEMLEMFRHEEDIGLLMDKLRARHWKRNERIEAYFNEKVALAKKAHMTELEIISHVIRGIDNFTVRTQLVTAQCKMLKDLFKLLKIVSRVH